MMGHAIVLKPQENWAAWPGTGCLSRNNPRDDPEQAWWSVHYSGCRAMRWGSSAQVLKVIDKTVTP